MARDVTYIGVLLQGTKGMRRNLAGMFSFGNYHHGHFFGGTLNHLLI